MALEPAADANKAQQYVVEREVRNRLCPQCNRPLDRTCWKPSDFSKGPSDCVLNIAATGEQKERGMEPLQLPLHSNIGVLVLAALVRRGLLGTERYEDLKEYTTLADWGLAEPPEEGTPPPVGDWLQES